MKILIDQDIPFIESFFTKHGELIKKPGRQIVSADLKGVDALLIRTITSVDETLIGQHQHHLKFIGSATSGDDHIDKALLNRMGISYATAKGSNAPAVVRYVLSSIVALEKAHKLKPDPLIAIVGVGCVGGLLATTLSRLGFKTILYDPPRAAQELEFISSTFESVLKADLICLHVPLIRDGPYPTYHMIGETVMSILSKETVVINAARGAVVDNSAIKTVGQSITWCLDVWEHEPYIDIDVLKQAFIATPHIAGYSKESKFRATENIYRQFCQAFGLAIQVTCENHDAKEDYFCTDLQPDTWRKTAFAYLNLWEKTKETQKALLESMETFEILRRAYTNLEEVRVSFT